ncbi:MAG: S1 family peptidase [Polyangiaceae bacterium]|nr:S1 family peptidase [Polyangiaceae bacterium]
MATHLPFPSACSRALLICLGLGAFGCANEVDTKDTVNVDVVDPAADLMVYGGVEDNDDQAVPGVVALRVGTGGTFELCSGALVAPNLVLTARHCVSKNVTTSVSCDENGRSANGKHISGEGDPTIIGIYTGATPNFARRPEASGHAIVTPRGSYLCNSDIALVVLDQSIDSVAPVAVRLQSTARVGETIRAVGYGQNDQGAPIGTRYRKSGVSVLAQGRAVSESGTPLGTHEFEVGRSICQGDSGGPAISEGSLAVIGVVSRGSGCDDNYGHIYTTTAGFDELFDEAFAIAGSTPILEVSTATGDNPSTQPQSTGQNPTESPSASSNTASCAIHPGGSRASSALLAAVGLAISLLLRRRHPL